MCHLQGEGAAARLLADPPTTLLCATHFDPDGMLRIKVVHTLHAGCL